MIEAEAGKTRGCTFKQRAMMVQSNQICELVPYAELLARHNYLKEERDFWRRWFLAVAGITLLSYLLLFLLVGLD